jgi:D-alanine--poly(phosphoribitol) ligase subunit 1
MNHGSDFQHKVIDPFLNSIQQNPDNHAFCINEVFYTYTQFGQSVSDIRTAFNKLSEENIYLGLVANDDIETYASIFAIWLEGKAYVPLHPNQPVNRCEDIISQMNIVTILDSSEVSRFQNHHVIDTKKLSSAANLAAAKNPIDENRIAYILFTSGSTGTPKGVMISRQNVAAFIDSFLASGITIGEYDKCLQCFDLTFDVSVQSFLVPLIKGACVYTIPHEQIKYSYVYGLLTDHKLTFGAMAPSMLRYLKPYFEEIDAPDMRCCILTAEASPVDLVAECRDI